MPLSTPTHVSCVECDVYKTVATPYNKAVLGTQYETMNWATMCMTAATNKWTWLYQKSSSDRLWSFCPLGTWGSL